MGFVSNHKTHDEVVSEYRVKSITGKAATIKNEAMTNSSIKVKANFGSF
jgi:hypothetical protein